MQCNSSLSSQQQKKSRASSVCLLRRYFVDLQDLKQLYVNIKNHWYFDIVVVTRSRPDGSRHTKKTCCCFTTAVQGNRHHKILQRAVTNVNVVMGFHGRADLQGAYTPAVPQTVKDLFADKVLFSRCFEVRSTICRLIRSTSHYDTPSSTRYWYTRQYRSKKHITPIAVHQYAQMAPIGHYVRKEHENWEVSWSSREKAVYDIIR